MPAPPRFEPLRVDPPPTLRSPLWTRSTLVLTILATAVAVLVTDVRDGPAGVVGLTVVALHVAVVALLVLWSVGAMDNVDALVPATRYSPPARGVLAAVLWVAGFAAPVGALIVVDRLGSRFADVEAPGPTAVTIAVVLVALLISWMPFRYHVRQAGRIGAPHGTMTAWYWVPLTVFVGGLSIMAFGVLPRTGASDAHDVTRVGGVYGLAAGTFAWTTWRAVTVFDEVIDIRWHRWKTEWEQTLADMAAQPVPGPERGGATP